MATLYLIQKAQKLELPDYEAQMKKKMAAFRKRLDTLKSLEFNTPEIAKALEDAEKAYQYFVYMYNAKTAAIPTLMSKKADEIFRKIERVKKLYGKVANAAKE